MSTSHRHSPSSARPARARTHGARTHRAAPSVRRGGLSAGPWLLDAGHLITAGVIVGVACVLAVRLARLPWAGYEDFEHAARLMGTVAGVTAAMAAAWRFSHHDPHSMLMTPTGARRVATRYGYIAAASVASIIAPLLVGAVVLQLPLLGENSFNPRFFFSCLVAAVGFATGTTAVGIVVASLIRSIPLIVRIVVAGGLSLLFGLYSATFGFLWPLGLQRYSDIVDAPEKMWAAGFSLLLGVVSFVGAVIVASRLADPFTPARGLGVTPFLAVGVGLAVGVATGAMPTDKPQLLCDSTADPNISVCVTQAQQPALRHSIDSANKALAVLGGAVGEEKIVYTPLYGAAGELGREVLYQPWQHRTNLGNNIMDSVINIGACNGDEHPESALLNSTLRSHLLEAAGLQEQIGVARDASGRIVRGGSTEGESTHSDIGDPFAGVPLETITAAIAAHPGEIANCTAQWEWFGVSPQ